MCACVSARSTEHLCSIYVSAVALTLERISTVYGVTVKSLLSSTKQFIVTTLNAS